MRTFFLFFSFFFLFIACEQKDNDIYSILPKDTEIVVGSVGGWCYGNDSLVFNGNKLSFYAYAPCEQKSYTKDSTISNDDLDALLSKLDMEDFRSIDINTCYTCVDGVDYWIRITDSEGSHTIRYGYQDSLEIEPVYNFAEEVQKIRESIHVSATE